MYKTKVVVGAQWGDEGKGKVSDFLAQNANVVVRYQGGNNAGHTIVFNNKKYSLNHIPSGIFNPKTINIMAQGMVINPKMLESEIIELENKGITDYNLYISDRAHVIFDYHREIDAKFEEIKGSVDSSKMIGTTKKGIGPAYEDKFARIGIRWGDFVNLKAFKSKLADTLLFKNKTLKALGIKEQSVEEIFNEYKPLAEKFKPIVKETGSLLEKLIKDDKEVIFEGAQGVMLCIDNGTYPYVTSSSPTSASVPLSTGISPKYIQNSLGIVKAYTTRVGFGSLPTELVDETAAEHIRKRGNEYGTVTNRPRRIGWLDTIVLKHSVRVSGLTELAITLLDVLDDQETIKIGYKYELDGQEIDYIPGSNFDFERVKVQYLEMPGWKTDITNVKTFKELPKNARDYILKIEELVGVKVSMFSVGPDRTQTIYR